MPLAQPQRPGGPLRRFAEKLVLIRTDAAGETRREIWGVPQTGKVMFGIKEDVEVGDVIEKSLPTGKVQRFRLTEVTYHNPPGTSPSMHHIAASAEAMTVKPAVTVRKVEISGMHPKISDAAGTLFADGHYSRAVQAAFQAVEHEVQLKAGLSLSGAPLMHKVFGAKPPMIDVARDTGRNADDEREGFHFLFTGSLIGLRNPRSHGSYPADSAEEAIELIALASALMRRL
jgi:uncharacterized protein (TIGR02391 family)